MRKYASLALGLGFALAAVAAEPVVGTLHDVKGAVTVSSAQAVKPAANGMAVTEGASILVARDAAATLALKNGCVVALKGSEHLAVSSKLSCDELQASVRQLMPTYEVAQAPLGGGIVPPPAAQADDSDNRKALVPLVGGMRSDKLAAIVFDTAIVIGAIAQHDHRPASGQ